MTFYRKETEKIELVARPGSLTDMQNGRSFLASLVVHLSTQSEKSWTLQADQPNVSLLLNNGPVQKFCLSAAV